MSRATLLASHLDRRRARLSGLKAVPLPIPKTSVSSVPSVSSVRCPLPGDNVNDYLTLDHENDLPTTLLLPKISSVGGGSLVKGYLSSNERFELT